MNRLHIGLLMTYNEADVLPEMLEATLPHVDAIFALDGSSDATPDILRACPKLEGLLFDRDVVPAGSRVRDGHRHALLEAARAKFGRGHWYMLLHADEFAHDDPRAVAAAAERESAGFVNWAAMQFFLHPSDADLYDAHGEPLEARVQHRVRWYSPFWTEVRQFSDVPQFPWGQVAYRPLEHGRVFPRGVRWKPFSRMPVLKHYPYRSPAQVAGKSQQPGFSVAHSGAQGVWRETAQPIYRTARRLEHPEAPDFGEFELRRQKSLLHMFLAQRKLLRR
jgi:hypothetical protein